MVFLEVRSERFLVVLVGFGWIWFVRLRGIAVVELIKRVLEESLVMTVRRFLTVCSALARFVMRAILELVCVKMDLYMVTVLLLP